MGGHLYTCRYSSGHLIPIIQSCITKMSVMYILPRWHQDALIIPFNEYQILRHVFAFMAVFFAKRR